MIEDQRSDLVGQFLLDDPAPSGIEVEGEGQGRVCEAVAHQLSVDLGREAAGDGESVGSPSALCRVVLSRCGRVRSARMVDAPREGEG